MFWKNRKERKYFLIFSIISLGIFGFVFLLFALNGKSMIWIQDGIDEYVPKTIYIAEWLRSLIHGGKVFDFSLGLGNDAITYNSIWFYDPFNLLFLFGPRNHYELLFHIGMALRFYAVGCSAYALLKHYGKNGMAVVAGALTYECNGYVLLKMLNHPNFSLPMIALPLLILTMERLIEKKKWAAYVITVALSAATSLYFFYMCVIFLIFYYVIRYRGYLTKGRIHLFFKNMFLVGGYSALAGCLIGVILIPDLKTLFLASRAGETHLATGSWWTFGFRRFISIFFKSITPGMGCEMDFHLGFLPLAFFAWILLFCRYGIYYIEERKANKKLQKISVSHKEDRKERNSLILLSGILGVFAVIPFCSYVLGAFGYVSGRWSFAVELLVAVIVCIGYEDLLDLRKAELLIFTAFVVFYDLGSLLILKQRSYYLAGFILTFSLFILWFMELFVKKNRTWKERILALMVIINCFFSVLFYHPLISSFLEQYAEKGKIMESLANEPISQTVDSLEDSDFYRVSRFSSNSVSAASASGYYGVIGYDNAASKYTNEFYREMGLIHNSINMQNGLNHRTVLENLLAVKYYALNSEKEKKKLPAKYSSLGSIQKEEHTYEIYENELALPLGFTYDCYVNEDTVREWTPLEKQDLMQTALILNEEYDGSSKDVIPACITIEPEHIEFENCSLEDGVLKVTSEEAKITWNFEPIPDCEYYVLLEGIDVTPYHPDIAVNFHARSKLAVSAAGVRSDGKPRAVRQRDYLLNVGYSRKGIDTCSLTISKKGEFDIQRICVLCEPMSDYAKNMKHLAEEKLENIQINKRTITGTVTAKDDKMLFLSIPYSEGWNAKIDGEKIGILRANYNFMALPVGEGKHQIELVYMTPGLRSGAVLSLAGLIVFIILYRRRKQIKNF